MGYRLAHAELLLIIGNMFRCFEIETAGVLDLTPKLVFTVQTREPVLVKLTPREAAKALKA